MSFKETVTIMMIWYSIGVASASLVVTSNCDRKWKREAIRAGFAEYYFDGEHNRQWRWKTNIVVVTNTTGRVEK